MTFRSHVKAPERAFDHLYDPNYKSSKKEMQKMNCKALNKTAPLHIIPCHHSMFSDLVTKRRNFYFPQRNQLPFIRCQSPVKKLCDRAINTMRFIYHSITQNEEVFQQNVFHPKPVESTRSIECQTTYRESSAQTDPWLPEAKLLKGDKGFPEVLLVETSDKPGLCEVEAIERARLRRDWEKALPSVNEKNLPLRIAQLKAFEWETIIAREKELNEEQMDRMEQVDELIEKRRVHNMILTDAKLENVRKRCKTVMNNQKMKLEIKNQRKLRKFSRNGYENYEDNKPKLEPSISLLDKMISKNNVKISVNHKLKPPWSSSYMNFINLRKNLWTPKDVSKRGLKPEKTLKLLHQSLNASRVDNKRESLKIRKYRELNFKSQEDDEVQFNESLEELGLSQNQVTMQETIKESEVIETFEINDKNRKNHSDSRLNVVVEASPDQCLNISYESHSTSETEVMTKSDLACNLKSFVDNILEVAVSKIGEKKNKTILKKSAEDRKKRQEESCIEISKQQRQIEIQRTIEEVYEKLADETLNSVLPTVIEIIASQDSRRFTEEIMNEVAREDVKEQM